MLAAIVSAASGHGFHGKHGIKGIVGGGAASGGAGDEVVTRWRDTLAAAGRETELGAGPDSGNLHTPGDTEEKAKEEIRQRLRGKT